MVLLIDNYIKKKDSFDIGSSESKSLLIDKYVTKKTTPTLEASVTGKSKTLLEKIKGVGKGVLNQLGKFGVGVGVEAANLVSSTLDFTADFFSKEVTRKLKGEQSLTPGPKAPGKTEFGQKMADRWQNFYGSTGGALTENIKNWTEDLRKMEFIKPSEEWVNASTKDKFTKKLPETILNIGPGVVSSLGMFAVNPVVGFAVSAGSTADEIKTIAMENGVNEDRAELLGLGTGLLVGFLDKIVPDEVFSQQQKKAFIGGLAKRVLKTGLKEAGTETIQEDVQLLVESTMRDDLGWDEVKLRNAMAGLGGLLGGVGAQTAVSFANNIRSGDIGGLEEDYVGEVETKDEKAEKPKVEVGSVAQPPKGDTLKQEIKIRPAQTKEITENQIKTTKNIKDTKTTLKRIRTELTNSVSEAEAASLIAKEMRSGVNVEEINKLKRIYATSKTFQEGDIETIRASKHGDLVNRIIENVQEAYPDMSEQEVFDFALNLPTKAEESARTPTIRELEKKEKKLAGYLDLLKNRQAELKIKEDDELSRGWIQVLAMQERLEKLISIPRRQLPVGEGKERVSRLQARLKGALDKTSQEEIEELGLTTYRQMNQNDQIASALEYVQNNPDEAIKVVQGEIDPPEGLLQNSVYAALVELGQENTDVATQVASLTSTKFGQEINILKKILADNPVVMMQDIVATRIEAYEKTTGRKANDRIKTEIKKIKKEVKIPDRQNWDNFLDSIRC